MNNYTLFQPKDDLTNLHRALEHPLIQEAYHYACEAYLENLCEYDSAKKSWATEQLKKPFLTPLDINTVDHLWNRNIKHKSWYDYVAYGACHWFVEPYLLLAEMLFPDGKWEVVVTDEHSAVIDVENKVIFDLVFSAYEIQPETILNMIKGTPHESKYQ